MCHSFYTKVLAGCQITFISQSENLVLATPREKSSSKNYATSKAKLRRYLSSHIKVQSILREAGHIEMYCLSQ